MRRFKGQNRLRRFSIARVHGYDNIRLSRVEGIICLESYRTFQRRLAMNDEHSELAGMKVLLVDDVPLNIEILFKTLKTGNHEISMADSGVKALELAMVLYRQ